jgi:hypothetical protein
MSVRLPAAALRAMSVPLLLAGGLVLAAAAPAAAEPGFGTATVVAEPPTPGTQVTVRSVTFGRHDDFDRVVFTVSGPTAGYRVGYVPALVQDASGAPVPIAGAAILHIALHSTTWTEHPSPVLNQSPRFPALRQIRSAGEFEGYATYGLGQATKAGFRVFRLTGPNRIVVDVRHPARSASSATPAAPAATEPVGAGTGSGAATTAGAPAGSGELAETGGATNPVPIAILGGLLALGGLVAVAAGVHLTRRPAR